MKDLLAIETKGGVEIKRDISNLPDDLFEEIIEKQVGAPAKMFDGTKTVVLSEHIMISIASDDDHRRLLSVWHTSQIDKYVPRPYLVIWIDIDRITPKTQGFVVTRVLHAQYGIINSKENKMLANFIDMIVKKAREMQKSYNYCEYVEDEYEKN